MRSSFTDPYRLLPEGCTIAPGDTVGCGYEYRSCIFDDHAPHVPGQPAHVFFFTLNGYRLPDLPTHLGTFFDSDIAKVQAKAALEPMQPNRMLLAMGCAIPSLSAHGFWPTFDETRRVVTFKTRTRSPFRWTDVAAVGLEPPSHKLRRRISAPERTDTTTTTTAATNHARATRSRSLSAAGGDSSSVVDAGDDMFMYVKLRSTSHVRWDLFDKHTEKKQGPTLLDAPIVQKRQLPQLHHDMIGKRRAGAQQGQARGRGRRGGRGGRGSLVSPSEHQGVAGPLSVVHGTQHGVSPAAAPLVQRTMVHIHPHRAMQQQQQQQQLQQRSEMPYEHTYQKAHDPSRPRSAAGPRPRTAAGPRTIRGAPAFRASTGGMAAVQGLGSDDTIATHEVDEELMAAAVAAGGTNATVAVMMARPQTGASVAMVASPHHKPGKRSTQFNELFKIDFANQREKRVLKAEEDEIKDWEAIHQARAQRRSISTVMHHEQPAHFKQHAGPPRPKTRRPRRRTYTSNGRSNSTGAAQGGYIDGDSKKRRPRTKRSRSAVGPAEHAGLQAAHQLQPLDLDMWN